MLGVGGCTMKPVPPKHKWDSMLGIQDSPNKRGGLLITLHNATTFQLMLAEVHIGYRRCLSYHRAVTGFCNTARGGQL